MRIKYIVLQATPTTIVEPSPTASPNVIFGDMLAQFQFVDAQNGWAITSDASGQTSLNKTTDGGQTWAVQVQ